MSMSDCLRLRASFSMRVFWSSSSRRSFCRANSRSLLATCSSIAALIVAARSSATAGRADEAVEGVRAFAVEKDRFGGGAVLKSLAVSALLLSRAATRDPILLFMAVDMMQSWACNPQKPCKEVQMPPMVYEARIVIKCRESVSNRLCNNVQAAVALLISPRSSNLTGPLESRTNSKLSRRGIRVFTAAGNVK